MAFTNDFDRMAHQDCLRANLEDKQEGSTGDRLWLFFIISWPKYDSTSVQDNEHDEYSTSDLQREGEEKGTRGNTMYVDLISPRLAERHLILI